LTKIERLQGKDYANRCREYYTSIANSCPGIANWDKFCTFTIDVGDAPRAAIDQSRGDLSSLDRQRLELAGGSAVLGGDAVWEVGQ
jgi:hypothetical protein